jgi:hypothetical protein
VSLLGLKTTKTPNISPAFPTRAGNHPCTKQKSRSTRAAAVFIHSYRKILWHTLAPPAEQPTTTAHTSTESGHSDVRSRRGLRHGFFSELRIHHAVLYDPETTSVNRIILIIQPTHCNFLTRQEEVTVANQLLSSGAKAEREPHGWHPSAQNKMEMGIDNCRPRADLLLPLGSSSYKHADNRSSLILLQPAHKPAHKYVRTPT